MQKAKWLPILMTATVLISLFFVFNALPVKAITAPSLSISGKVWHDQYVSESHKVDGIQDAGEPGIAGVTVELYDSSNTLVTTTTTASDGSYSFSGLNPGTYRVKIADSNFDAGGALDNTSASLEWYATMQDQGGDDTVDSDGDESSHDVTVSLSSGDIVHVDFGFFRSCVSLQKTGPASMNAGDTINYHFRVENCGDVVLHGGVSVYDPLIEPSGDHEIWWSVVYPGEVYEFDRSYTTDASSCPVLTNSATAEGHPLHPRDDSNLPTVTAEDSWTVSCYTFDWGDAPDSYDTTLAADGPRHILGSGLVIGSSVDADSDGQPTADASGDDAHGSDDEDGLSACISLTRGQTGLVSVPVNNPLSTDATLYGWIDFNGNGTFEAGDEYRAVSVPAGTNGPVTLDFGTVPLTSTTSTFARLRLTTDALCTGGSGTYRDEFSAVAYNNSDGNADWSTYSWQELNDDGSPSGGDITIDNGRLRFVKLEENEGIERRVDLSGATQATLTFDWETEDLEEELAVYISADGSNFTLLGVIKNEWSSGSKSFDISAYASANTTIRFLNTYGDWSATDDKAYVDNLQITFSSGCTGGLAHDGEVEDHPVCIQTATGSIGDYVWNDTNGNGLQDEGAGAGISNVTVELYDNDTCTGSPVATTTTGADGSYEFTGLAAGTYSVKFSPLSGYVFSPMDQGTDDGADSDAHPITGCTGAIVLSAGQHDTTWDAGMYQPTPQLLIDKDTFTPSVPAGGEATYRIVVWNVGTGIANGVTISDTLPSGFTYNRTVSIETSGPVTRTASIAPMDTLLGDKDYIYAFGGKNTPNFWRYDLGSASWQVLADAPGNVHAGGDIAMANGYIYGMGGGSTNAFWRYDPATNTWDDAAAADVPLPPGKEVGTGGALTYDGRYIYAIVGGNDSSTDNDLWRYDPQTDTWTLLTYTPVPQSGGSDITYGDGYIYFLGGNDGNDNTSQWGPQNPGYEFYRYNIAANSWERLHDLPNVEPAKEGAAIVFHSGSVLGGSSPSGSIYAWVGGDKKLYYRYDIATDTWVQDPPVDSPYKVENGSDLCSDGSHSIYGFPATDTQYFQVYDTNGDTWTQLTQTPAQVHDGGSLLCAFGNGTPKWGTWAIGSGGIITITFVADVASTVPAGTYDNTAYADADNYHLVDDDGTQAQDSDTPSGKDPEDDEDVTVGPATGSIGDRVWNDANGDGVQDAGEPGINNVTLHLYRDDGDGVFEPGSDDVLVGTQTTSGDGNYDFTGVTAGSYWVDVDEDTLATGYYLTTGNQPLLVTLGAGQDYNDADFGYAGKGNISGVVFYDWNENGTQDAGEDGISGVEVCLYKDDGNGVYDTADTQEECKNTNTDGSYVFNDYMPGTYFVVESQPPDLEDTTPNVRKVELVVIGPSGSATDNDFGDIVKGRIGDFAWVDSDGDGLQDAGETSGIPNLPLHVTGVNVLNQSIDITVTTSITGYYTVSDLLPGTYTVTAPASFSGFVRTSASPLTTTLTVGDMEDLTLDFGYVSPTGVELISFQYEAMVIGVRMAWTVRLTDGSVPGFRVWRAVAGGRWKLLTPDWLDWDRISGNEASYSYEDTTVYPGTSYVYKLESEDGTFFGPWQVDVPEVDDGGGRIASRHVFMPFLSR